MRRALALFLLLGVAPLLACGSAPIQRTQYLLRAEPRERAGPVDVQTRIALGRVTVAPYLEQDGIVLETGDGQVRAANQHVWAEPLEAGLRSSLRAEVSDALGIEVSARPDVRLDWDYVVDVHVDRLHGSMDGTALLDAAYRISPRSGAGEPVDYQLSRRAPLAREGYDALVEAELRLVKELAVAIAGSLRGTLAP